MEKSSPDKPAEGVTEPVWNKDSVAYGFLKMSSPDEPAEGAASLVNASLPKEQTRSHAELALNKAAPGVWVHRSERPPSPVFSVISMKSDRSMDTPMQFKGQERTTV